jgi:hypothetical protein
VALIVVVMVRAAHRRGPGNPGGSVRGRRHRTIVHGVRPVDKLLAPESGCGSYVLPAAPDSAHANGERYQSFDVAHADREALVGQVAGFRRAGPVTARRLQPAGCDRCLLYMNTVASNRRVCMVSRLVRNLVSRKGETPPHIELRTASRCAQRQAHLFLVQRRWRVWAHDSGPRGARPRRGFGGGAYNGYIGR